MSNTTHTDRIRQMAQEAGFAEAWIDAGANPPHHPAPQDLLTRFAQLVAEDCAKVAVECRDDVITADNSRPDGRQNSGEWARGVYGIGSVIDHEIRARYTNEG